MTNWELFLSKHSRAEIICSVESQHCGGCFIEKACYGKGENEINKFLDAETEEKEEGYATDDTCND